MRNISILISILFLFSCTSKNSRPKEYELILVETSDVHGAVFNFDFINNHDSKTSLSQVHSYVKDLRKTSNVVLMDNGDILQGQPVVYYSNYVDTDDKHIVSKVMNYMQYDVATIGNHDIEAGHQVYDKLIKEFNFTWLAANAINKQTGEPYFEPYTVLDKDGIKIAILGLITPGVPNWLPEELWSGIEFEDMVESAKKWVPIIVKEEQPDLLIGLFHSGYDYTYGNSEYKSYKNENASRIVAEQVPGFDIIFVGHDHRTWNEKVKNVNGNEVLVLGPTSSARQVMTATIHFQKNEEGKYFKNIVGNVVNINDYEPDSCFIEEFKDEFEKVQEFVSEEVGEFENTILTQDAFYGPSEFIDFINQVQLDISHADISFTAPLSFNDKIEAGPLYVRDMFKLYRFENFLYTMNLTGEEIDKYMEYSFGNWFNTMKLPSDNLLMFKKDKNGNLIYSERHKSYSLNTQFFNFDVASGIMYTVNVTKPFGEKVNITSLSNGEIFSIDSTYIVAVNSYRGNGGGGHLTTGVGLSKDELKKRRISSTDKDLRFYMMKWIEEKGSVKAEIKNEWYIVPKDWWKQGKQKDYKLLN